MPRTRMSITQLEQELATIEPRHTDRIVPASDIRMEHENGHLMIQGEPHPVQDQVLSLLGPKLEVPAHYLRKCPPWLRAENVNHWIEGLGEKDLMVRYDGPDVRAVLSTRYTPVSNLELIRLLKGSVLGN